MGRRHGAVALCQTRYAQSTVPSIFLTGCFPTCIDYADNLLRLSGMEGNHGRIRAATGYAKHAETVAAAEKAESDELQALLSYELARAELNPIAGASER